jgi:hypothetical protein
LTKYASSGFDARRGVHHELSEEEALAGARSPTGAAVRLEHGPLTAAVDRALEVDEVAP